MALSTTDLGAYGATDDNATTAARLAARAQLLQSTDPAALELSALLAIESMKRAPSADADHTLRSAMALLRTPFKRVPDTREISAIALSPDGRFLAMAGTDNTLRITAVTSDEVFVPHTHEHRITQIMFSPDSSLIATVAMRTVQVFDLFHSAPLRSLALEADVIGIAFGKNGRLATGTVDGFAKVIDVRTGAQIARFHIDEPLRLIALNPSARILAMSGGPFVRLYDIDSQRELPHSPLRHGGIVRMIKFSLQPDSPQPNGMIATASQDGIARVFKVSSGELLGKWAPNPGFPITLVALASGGHLVAMGSTDNVVRVFRIARECDELSSFHHEGALVFLDFAARDSAIVTGSTDRTVRIFDASSGRELARMVHPAAIAGVSTHEGSGTIATASAGLARLFHVTLREPGSVSLGDSTQIGRFAFSRSGTLLIASGKHVHLFDSGGEEHQNGITLEYPLNTLAYSNDGTLLAVSTIKGITSIYKNGVPHVIANSNTIAGGAPASGAAALGFSFDNSLLALAGNSTSSNGQDQTYVRTFNAATYAEIGSPQICAGLAQSVAVGADRTIVVGTSDRVCIFRADAQYSPVTDESITALAFNPASNLIAVGSQRGTVRILTTSGAELFHTYPHGDSINTVFFVDNQRFATLTQRGIIRVFDLQKRDQVVWLAQLARSFTVIDGILVTLSQDERGLYLQTHQIAPTALIQQACSRVSRNLFEAEWQTHVAPAAHYQRTCHNLP